MSTEGTAPVQTCCVCAQREPIACGVCLGVSTLSDDVLWFARRMEQLHAELAAARAEVIEQNIKRTEAEEVADDRRKRLIDLLERLEFGEIFDIHEARGMLERAKEVPEIHAQGAELRAELARARLHLVELHRRHAAALDQLGWSTDERLAMDSAAEFLGGAS